MTRVGNIRPPGPNLAAGQVYLGILDLQRLRQEMRSCNKKNKKQVSLVFGQNLKSLSRTEWLRFRLGHGLSFILK